MPIALWFAGATPPYLAEIAIIIFAGAAVGYISLRMGLLPIIGFLLAGVLIGPNCLALVRNMELIDAAAETGVMLLLFTIGIEFSLEKLASIKRAIFLGGGIQVALCTAAIALLLGAWDVPWSAGVFTGFLVALSSTAIVLKLLGDRGQTNSAHGQIGLAILIFQDLAIIAMVMFVPMLAGQGGSSLDLAIALGKAVAIIFAVLLVARRVMPVCLEMVARTCSPEVFLLTVIAICFGTALLTSLAGVSVSLGAFLAGLVVSESRHSHRAMGDILPLQILFSATFFLSVGMLLNLQYVYANIAFVAAAIAVTLLVKVFASGISILALREPLPVAALGGLMLAQVGEFSFVLEHAGRNVGLSPAGMGMEGSQAFIATTVILMVFTPSLLTLGERLSNWMERRRTARPLAAPATMDVAGGSTETARVLISGYGPGSLAIARALRRAGVPFHILTLSPVGASEAEALGFPVTLADSTRSTNLVHAGIQRASALVIADDDAASSHQIISVVRSLAPDLLIFVRTTVESDASHLVMAGATVVVSDEGASTAQLSMELLSHLGDTPDANTVAYPPRQAAPLAKHAEICELRPPKLDD